MIEEGKSTINTPAPTVESRGVQQEQASDLPRLVRSPCGSQLALSHMVLAVGLHSTLLSSHLLAATSRGSIAVVKNWGFCSQRLWV